VIILGTHGTVKFRPPPKKTAKYGMQKPGPAAKNETEYLRNQKKNDDGEIKLQFNLQLNK